MSKFRILLCALLALCLFTTAAVAASLTDSLKPGKADLKSAGVLAFGPEGVLFVGDSLGGAVFAIDTQDRTAVSDAPAINITDIGSKIAALLGTEVAQIQLNDVAVNPVSHKPYISVSRGRGTTATPVIIRVDGTGKLDVMAMDNVKFSKAVLPNPVDAAQNQRLQTITDLAFVNNMVYVAGLTNEEFSSNMRTIPFPFAQTGKGASIEIWHGSHAQFETNSPVRTFVPMKIKGEDYVIAAYTCTPIVKIPVSALKPGSKVEGTTIAEMGAGNRPLDMIVYAKGGKDFILMANSSHGVTRMSANGLEAYSPITKSVNDKAGIPYDTIAGLTNVVQLDALDGQRALILTQVSSTFSLKTIPLP